MGSLYSRGLNTLAYTIFGESSPIISGLFSYISSTLFHLSPFSVGNSDTSEAGSFHWHENHFLGHKQFINDLEKFFGDW